MKGQSESSGADAGLLASFQTLVRDVQHPLGHANLQTTEIYMPLVVNDLREGDGRA
jgi:site-specific recombinase XerC